MFSICKEFHSATGIEHAITCNFFNKSEKSLLVAGTNILKVFRLIPNIETGIRTFNIDDHVPKMKMECICEFTLHANVMSLQSINIANTDRDAILLSFRDAKLSIVEYDPELHDLRTLSLHYFEEDDIKDSWTQNYQIPIIRIDPENRCAAMLLYGRKIAIFPFKRDVNLDENVGGCDIKPLIDTRSNNKEPIMSSYIIALRDLSEKVDNVIDMQFLHGYYEPTLLLLFEPIRTFAGRAAIRKDTCAIVAISINVQQKVQPIIWSVSNLPFDCTQAVPVPKPIGGVIIFSVNALIYLNQSVPSFGISLNTLAETYTKFPLKPQDELDITLDCAQATFILEDTLVISLKSGDLYVLTLISDSIRTIRNFHFDKVAASVLTTCIAAYEDNFLFLGSRLGNSLLLRYIEKEKETINNVNMTDTQSNVNQLNNKDYMETTDDPVEKTLYDFVATDVFNIRDVDEFEVYGDARAPSLQIKRYIFEVCDSLINIGPCGNVTIGESAFLSEEFSQSCDYDLEMVTTSGYGKNGALCVLQRSIRPQLITTFQLPGCFNMWSLSKSSGHHAYLLISQEESSIVLETGSEVNELDNTGFITNEITVYACNLGKNRFYAQVTLNGIHLLQNNVHMQFLSLNSSEESIVFGCSSDPYVAVLTNIGQVYVAFLKETKHGNTKLAFLKTKLENNPGIVAISIYRDISGLFTDTIPNDFTEMPENIRQQDLINDMDDEDDLLYGENSTFEMPTLESSIYLNTVRNKKSRNNWWKRYLLDIKNTYWLFVVRDNMNLEIYSVPELNLSYLIKEIGHGHELLNDELESISNRENISNIYEFVSKSQVEVKEIRMVALGSHGSRPLLFIRITNNVFIYDTFRYIKGNIKIRFRKLPISMIYSPIMSDIIDTENINFYAIQEKKCLIRYFSNITGYNGVFIAGEKPHWIFLTYRGELRAHPMSVDGCVICFTSFNNANCPHGFIYLNSKDQVRIGILPTHLNYDAPWPVRKVPLRSTPHFVSYHVESKTYCLVTSIQETSNQYYRFNGEDKELTFENRLPNFPFPVQDLFTVMLFSPIAWESIPNTKIDLDEWEHVTCMKNVSLAYEGTTSGLRGYIVIGTNYNYGEDVTSRGRILIYDIIDVVPEPGQPLTKNKFKTLYDKEQKGPVTAVSQVLGFLISAIGQKIYIWQLKDNDLVGVAFIDTQIYTHKILAVKSLILVSDVYKSVSLLRFQEEHRTLSLVARDYKPCQVVSAEFMVDNANLGFIVSDAEKNLIVYMHQPKSRESCGGTKLLRKADFYLGQIVNSFFRIKCKTTHLVEGRKQLLPLEHRHITFYATLDGSIGCLLPVSERLYRRLLMLQNVLISYKPHVAGLNPKEFRTFKSSYKSNTNICRSIIDGGLIWSFLTLSINEKVELSRKIGIKYDEIQNDMNDISELINYF